jgi:putative ABC transport system permease protein
MKRLRILRNVQLGVKTLWLHKMRSLLTMLGVVFGVGSVIAMLAVGEGASQEALSQIQKLGSQNIIVESIKPIDSGSSTTRSYLNSYGLEYDDARRIAETIPTVQRTVPVKVVRKDARLGTRNLELRVVGTTSEWFDLVRRPLVAGRVLTPHDDETRSNVLVMTEYGARRLLATEATIGQSLRIASDIFEVVGIVESEDDQGSGMQTPDRAVDAYISLPVARERFGDISVKRSSGSFTREKVELHYIICQVDALENVESTAAAIETVVKRFHPRSDYKMSVPLALLRQAQATKRTFNIVLGSIAGISLLVGGIGIMNIMLASVTERTREIGIRRAIGARRRQIVGQFLVETVVLSMTGGLIGVGVGLLIPKIISHFAGLPTIVPLYSVVLSLGISMAVGILFGLYPAVRAARLDPIVALRHE